MERKFGVSKSLLFLSDMQFIPNVYDLERIGLGDYGVVFRYKDKVIKLFRQDINYRKENKLMTLDKALYFKNELNLKRIAQPIDMLLDSDGIYSADAMNYLEDVTLDNKNKGFSKQPGEFTCRDLICAISEFQDDFHELTEKKVLAKGIDTSNFIFTTDFLHLCGMDRFVLSNMNRAELEKSNIMVLNSVFARLLYNEMISSVEFDIVELRQLSNWIKHCTPSLNFTQELIKEASLNCSCLMEEFAKEKVKKIMLV